MSTFLMIIFYILLLCNAYKIFTKTKSKALIVFTVLFLAFLMCGHHYIGNGDSRDLYGYEHDFELLKIYGINGVRDFAFYYLFYFTQIIAIKLGIDFFAWWSIMTIIAWCVILWASKKFGLNMHYFLTFFMTYYVFVFYTGFKFFYGMCLLLIAIGYFIRNQKHDFVFAVVFLLLAGGMHVMYYLFLILLLTKVKFIKIKHMFIVALVLFIGSAFLARGQFQSMLTNVFTSVLAESSSDNAKSYTAYYTNLGFVIPVTLHLICCFYSFTYAKYIKKSGMTEYEESSKLLLLLNLVCVLFYPLYLFAMTFNRLNTAFSIITIGLTSAGISKMRRSFKRRLVLIASMMIVIYFVLNFVLDDYYHYAYLPLFDNYFLNNLFY